MTHSRFFLCMGVIVVVSKCLTIKFKKMKKVLLFLSSCVFLFSCQSREEKVAELIKQQMFKTLYDFESYEPIETSQIDSVFTSIYTDSTAIEHASLIIATMDIGDEYVEEANDYCRTIEIWGDSYSSYGRGKVRDAYDKLKEVRDKLEAALQLVEEYRTIIKERNKNFESEFIGWSVTHKFRCKNKGGNFDLGTYQFVIDPKFEKVQYFNDLEDEESKKITDVIKQSIEYKEEQVEEE